MTIHSTVSLVSYTKASLAQCIGSIIINITAGESASSTSAGSATTKARSLEHKLLTEQKARQDIFRNKRCQSDRCHE